MFNCLLNSGAISSDIKSALSRQLFAPLGNQANISWTDLLSETQHLIGHSHFQIHAGLEYICQHANVTLLNVPAILPQMQRNTIGASLLSLDSSLYRVGITSPARLTQRGHVIDIDT
tara:strand:- start:214 stop:564 length:351 start_codon:yes stop_codon:yes gene_type:complete